MFVPLVVAVVALVMMWVERARPARAFPTERGWIGRALLLNALQGGLLVATGTLWDGWILRHRPWSLDGWGVVPAALLGYLVHSFVYYFWHRARHASPFLWRWVHQVHHSPGRLTVIASFYKHPIEIVLNSLLSSLVLYWVVGLGPTAAAVTFLISGLAELWYHWNVRTPHWLGYVIQRPESHCVHHQQGLHAHNYGDLPIFDLLFGTLLNPRAWSGRVGFGEGAERRLPEMLRGKDVSAS